MSLAQLLLAATLAATPVPEEEVNQETEEIEHLGYLELGGGMTIVHPDPDLNLNRYFLMAGGGISGLEGPHMMAYVLIDPLAGQHESNPIAGVSMEIGGTSPHSTSFYLISSATEYNIEDYTLVNFGIGGGVSQKFPFDEKFGFSVGVGASYIMSNWELNGTTKPHNGYSITTTLTVNIPIKGKN